MRSGTAHQGAKFDSLTLRTAAILLLSQSATALQDLLHVCESVLCSLDLFINHKKSVCTRIDPRCNNVCCDIVSSTSYGYVLQWVDSIRYLEEFILLVCTTKKCNLFGKVIIFATDFFCHCTLTWPLSSQSHVLICWWLCTWGGFVNTRTAYRYDCKPVLFGENGHHSTS